MQIDTDGQTVQLPDSAFITTSSLNNFIKCENGNNPIVTFISDPSCSKISSEHIRDRFESNVSDMADFYRFLGERAESIIEAKGKSQTEEEILEKIFDADAISNEYDGKLPDNISDSLEKSQEKTNSWDLSEMPEGLFQAASAVERKKRKINTELINQFDWREFSFNSHIRETFDGEFSSKLIEHTYMCVYNWSNHSEMSYVVAGSDSAMFDTFERASEIFNEIAEDDLPLRVVTADCFQMG